MKYLVVNADDFGLSEGVNRAIIKTHLHGSVSSTTLMVNQAGTRHAVNLSKTTPELALGLHANLTLGTPVERRHKIDSLVGSCGGFYCRSVFEKRLFLGLIRTDQLMTELRAQFNKFVELTGTKPSHIDSHQHIHTIPPVFRVLAEIATRNNIPLRMPWPRRNPLSLGLRRQLRSRVLGLLLSWNKYLSNKLPGTNTGFCSLFDLTKNPSDIDDELYSKLLSVYKTGFIELMVHPAEVDDIHRENTQISEFSAREYEWLCSGALRDLLEKQGFKLTSYAEFSKLDVWPD